MTDLDEILKKIPLFSFLEPAELEALRALFTESVHQKGAFICREDDPGDTFHVIVDGELEVIAGPEQRVIATLKRGQFFGEMALLQEGGKRTASVMASRRVVLMTLDRAAFKSHFLNNPKALEVFTSVLSKRVVNANKGEVARASTLTIAIGSSRSGLKGKTLVAKSLAGILNDLTGADVLVVQIVICEKSTELDASGLQASVTQGAKGISVVRIEAGGEYPAGYYAEKASNLISMMAERFSFMIFDLGDSHKAVSEATPLFADVFLDLVEYAAPAAPAVVRPAAVKGMKKYPIINLYNQGSRRIPLNSCEPFLIPQDSALSGPDAAEYIRANSRKACALPIHRLARKILGATMGLALGGGAAFGIAHLGVIQVLERNDIPIDLVSGCSQGSLIGVGLAAGLSTASMIEQALSLGRKENSLLAVDLTMTRPGLLAGDKFVKIFAPLLGARTQFEDLIMPCTTVATDIESGERISIGTGSLTAAFRASASVPMVFAPVRIGEHVLVDGGVADPVPAEVVMNMGADLCIAVNVVPPLKRGVENAVSKTIRQLNRLNPLSYLGGNDDMPNMFDIIMNSMQILQYELGNFKAKSADVLINPDLSDFTWVEYYRSGELIERGVEAAEASLDMIRKVYDNKLARWRRTS